MNLTFQLIDPAGGGLLLVHTPVPREAYADLTRAAGHPGAGPPPGSLPHRPHPGAWCGRRPPPSAAGRSSARPPSPSPWPGRSAGSARCRWRETGGQALPAQVNPLTGQATLDFPPPGAARRGERGDRLLFPGWRGRCKRGARCPRRPPWPPATPGPGPGDRAPGSRPAGLGLPPRP